MAPHGGGIEPGTTEIAEAVAGHEHTFYSFSGVKARGNSVLHITSSRFDEPEGIAIAKEFKSHFDDSRLQGPKKNRSSWRPRPAL